LPKSHVIKRDTFHYKWSKSHKPVLSIKPGDRVHFEVNEVLSWQITKESKVEDLTKVDLSKAYPLAGPVFIEGAKRGDALVVNIESVNPADWGWSAIIPGMGLLDGEEFSKKPELYIWRLPKRGNKYANFVNGIKVPLNPFCGVLGVAPFEDGYFEVMPPGRHGGNMDIRYLTGGSKVIIPVWNEGGLFSVGDMHAAQGDGEVCLTAIECPGDVTLSFEVIKNANLKSPQYFTKRPLFGFDRGGGYFSTTGISPDLMEAAKESVRNMVSYLHEKLGIRQEHAYMLCSVVGELRIHEIVDRPNWVVGMMVPRKYSLKQRESVPR
jgi:acetamidase/formamidase